MRYLESLLSRIQRGNINIQTVHLSMRTQRRIHSAPGHTGFRGLIRCAAGLLFSPCFGDMSSFGIHIPPTALLLTGKWCLRFLYCTCYTGTRCLSLRQTKICTERLCMIPIEFNVQIVHERFAHCEHVEAGALQRQSDMTLLPMLSAGPFYLCGVSFYHTGLFDALVDEDAHLSGPRFSAHRLCKGPKSSRRDNVDAIETHLHKEFGAKA